jgi:tRNA dimethylallyltransferase
VTEHPLVLVGATASGKSALAMGIARLAGDVELVSADSMQVYRGMDIGTAKPDAEMRARVPHHLLDVFDPAHDVTVSEFQDLARAAIDDISARGKLPLLVGGSGLYLRAVVDELSFPPRAEDVRKRLEDEVDELGPEALYERLVELDPKAAERIEPGNARRTVRALEVIEITGRPFSENVTWDTYESIYDLSVVGLTRPREELYERIGRRVDAMLQEGLVEEVERVAAAGMSRTARQALGYRQVLEASPEAVRDEIVKATKRFARRQESWFRADPRVRWIDASDDGAAEAIRATLGAPEDLV